MNTTNGFKQNPRESMRPDKSLRIALFWVLGLFPALAACDDVARWTEDVQLHDGTIVQLERRATQASSGFPVAHRGIMKSYELCYPKMKVYWKSNAEFPPMHFETQGGVAYVKVPVASCIACKVMGYPTDSVAHFALKGREWVRIASSEFPDRRWRNLIQDGIFDPRDPRKDIKGHIALSEKWKIDRFTEDSPGGRAAMKRERNICTKCATHDTTTDLKLEATSTPVDVFCR